MMNKSRLLLLIAAALSAPTVAMALFFLPETQFGEAAIAPTPSHAMHFSLAENAIASSASPTLGSTTVKTALGNDITFGYAGVASYENSWQLLQAGGSFYNATPIHGLQSIEVSFLSSGRDFTLAWSYDTSFDEGTTYSSSASFTNYFGNVYPSHFRLENTSAEDLVITSMTLRYDCRNYSEASTDSKLAFTLSDGGDHYIVGAANQSISGQVEIPSYYNGLPVKEIKVAGFASCGQITGVSLPGTLTKINNGAFQYCSALASVSIPDSVTSIGSRVFDSCYALASAELSNGITFLGDYLFNSCSSLESIVIPEGVLSINLHCFAGCGSLTSIALPSSLQLIGQHAFDGCSALTSLNLGNSLQSLGFYALKNCTKLTHIVLPASLTSVSGYAFANCNDLEIAVDSANPNYKHSDGALYSKDGSTLISWQKSLYGACDVLEGTTAIGDGALYGSSLTTLRLPDSVSSIGYQAFYGSGLKAIALGKGVTSIGNAAFDYVTLSAISIPAELTAISSTNNFNREVQHVFYAGSPAQWNAITGKSSNLMKASIEYNRETSSLLYVDESPFQYVLVDASDVYSLAGSGNTVTASLIETMFEGLRIRSISSFYKCSNLSSFPVENLVSVRNLGGSGITSLILPDSVTFLSSSVCNGCASLRTVSLGSGISVIPASAFAYCYSLTSVSLPSSITAINANAFQSTNQLSSITYSGTMEQWEQITKANNWTSHTLSVICTDGTIDPA